MAIPQKPSKFRDPDSGRRYTANLFYERCTEERRVIDPIFSIEIDRPGLINFRKEYVLDEDKTGYKTSNRLLESFDHFKLLEKTCRWFREAKSEWDLEIDAKLEARATDTLKSLLASDELKPSERLTAAREILKRVDKGHSLRTNVRKAGRPTKAEVEGQLKIDTAEEKALRDDWERINPVKLTLVAGGGVASVEKH